jgi:hypothetical protein
MSSYHTIAVKPDARPIKLFPVLPNPFFKSNLTPAANMVGKS